MHLCVQPPRLGVMQQEAREFGAALVFDAATDPPDAGPARGVVLAHGGEARAATLLEQGVIQVFVGDAALVDASVMTRLVARFGGSTLGLGYSLVASDLVLAPMLLTR